MKNNDELLGAFGLLINAMSGGGNKGNPFPEDDAIDLRNGAKYIPGEVTIARRRGENVIFNSEKHEWTFPDGKIVS